MSKTRQPSLKRLFAATRKELMEILEKHGVLHVQTEMWMRKLTSDLEHANMDIQLGATAKRLDVLNGVTQQLHILDAKLRLLAKEHDHLFDSVVDFNVLTMNSADEEVKAMFICFDDTMSKIFGDQWERFNRPLPKVRPLRIPNQSRWC